MPDLTEECQVSLAERVVAGDRDAENELVHLFSPRIFAMLCARTRDREASRDLLHDVLITVLGAVRNGQLRDPAKLASFVHGIARHLAQNHLRSRDTREQPMTEEPAAESAGDILEASERRDLIRQALGELDATDQDILIRTLVNGEKPGFIARALGLKSEVVRQRKSRATKRVAEFVRKAVTNRGRSTTFQ